MFVRFRTSRATVTQGIQIMSHRFAVVSTMVLALLASSALADNPQTGTAPDDAVDLFAAMDAGDIDAKLIVKDIKNAKLVVRNMTDKPLTIKLPEAIAAVPVLAQAQGGGGGGAGGFFSVPPEKVAKQDLGFLCLEHGKPDPKSTTQYVIKPIDQITTNPLVVEVIKGMGKGVYGHDAAQAACWHLQNGLSWEELAAKERRQLLRPTQPYFNAAEMRQAVNIVEHVKKIVEEQGKASESDSLATQ
jgi:hypothetical protein